MSNCSSCPSSSTCKSKNNEQFTQSCTVNSSNKNIDNIKNIIGVMSGKGGVGKSTLTTLIAKKLINMGYKVGILDSDVTGPSIPRLTGLSEKRAISYDGTNINPIITTDNIKTISVNYLVDSENQPIVWKGPIISKTITQFYKDVVWGELDYLLIDMPPGTGDVALTVMQTIPINGVIMITIPQDMVSMIVEKAVKMAEMLNVKVLGVIENMSYIKCPNCDTNIEIFKDGTESLLDEMNLKLLGKLPMTRDVIDITHNGNNILDYDIDKTLEEIVNNLL